MDRRAAGLSAPHDPGGGAWGTFGDPRHRFKVSRVLPPLRGNSMEVGCGARVREIRGHRYFYFWHYERDGGRSRRVEEYIGRVEDARARTELLRRMGVYHAKAEQEFARRRVRIERLVARAVVTSTQR